MDAYDLLAEACLVRIILFALGVNTPECIFISNIRRGVQC